jgi:2,3-bisphosphoglycerate-dependent phosphoglycerate mutase
MKRTFLKSLLLFAVLAVFVLPSLAQGKKTIVLIRHAEKEVGDTVSAADPPLSAAGVDRAQRVAKRIGKFHPGAIYSTNYKRTRDTVEPLAKKRGKTVEIYDPANAKDLAAKILASPTKRFVVVGHSNTIPALANLLTGKDLFKNLQESEYSVIYVIRIRNGKVTKVELLDY